MLLYLTWAIIQPEKYCTKSHYPPGDHHMLIISTNVLFPGHNHLLPSVLMTHHFNYRPSISNNQSVWSPIPVVSWCLWPGNRTFLEVASMAVTWWIVFFCAVRALLFSFYLAKYVCQGTSLAHSPCIVYFPALIYSTQVVQFTPSIGNVLLVQGISSFRCIGYACHRRPPVHSLRGL